MTSEPLWPESYGVHPDHCRDVIEGGSYDVPFNPATPPVILDIGANVGAFVRWSVKRWPGCVIHAYEPHPGNFALLTRTINALESQEGINCHNVAVAEKESVSALSFAGLNCGEWSLLIQPKDAKETVQVRTISAATLPVADILKIDAEGAEIFILGTLKDRIAEFSAVMMEVHNNEWLPAIIGMLQRAGFTMTGYQSPYPNRTELKFVKTNLLPKTSP